MSLIIGENLNSQVRLIQSFGNSYFFKSDSIKSEDDVLENKDDSSVELDDKDLDENVISIIIKILKEKYNCICIRKKD